MEVRLLKYLLLTAAIMSFFIPPADALNLGSLQKSLSKNISAGETAAFNILFWNSEEQEYVLEMSNAESPNGWSVIIFPRQFRLNSTPGGKTERIYLPNTKDIITAKIVEVYITVPEGEARGKYTVRLKATAGNGESSGFSVMQERQFLLDVNVIGGRTLRTDGGEKRTVLIDASPLAEVQRAAGERASNALSASSELPEGRNIIAGFVALIAILIAAWRVYGHD